MKLAREAKKTETTKVVVEESIADLKAKIAKLESEKKADNEPKPVQILRAYQTGRSSIQTIARAFNVDVAEVLEIIGEGNLASVTFGGDMIDEDEAGRESGRAPMNYGQLRKIPFSAD